MMMPFGFPGRSLAKPKVQALKLVPMLLRPAKGITKTNLQTFLTNSEIKTQFLYDDVFFALIPNKKIVEIRKIATLRNAEIKKPIFGKHELLIAQALLLEKTLAFLSEKKDEKQAKLQILHKESLDNKEAFKRGLKKTYASLRKNQQEILNDSYRLIGKKKLNHAILDLVKEEIKAHPKSKMFLAKLRQVLESLNK